MRRTVVIISLALVAIVVLVWGVGYEYLAGARCGGKLGQLRRQEILATPPGATRLGKFENDTRCGIILRISGDVTVTWASTVALPDIEAWYQARFGQHYSLTLLSGALVLERRTLAGHPPGRRSITVGVDLDSRTVPYATSDELSRLAPSPSGTRTFIRVGVSDTG